MANQKATKKPAKRKLPAPPTPRKKRTVKMPGASTAAEAERIAKACLASRVNVVNVIDPAAVAEFLKTPKAADLIARAVGNGSRRKFYDKVCGFSYGEEAGSRFVMDLRGFPTLPPKDPEPGKTADAEIIAALQKEIKHHLDSTRTLRTEIEALRGQRDTARTQLARALGYIDALNEPATRPAERTGPRLEGGDDGRCNYGGYPGGPLR